MEAQESFEIVGEAKVNPEESIALVWRPVSEDKPPVPQGAYRRGPVMKAVAAAFFDDKGQLLERGELSSRDIYSALGQVEEANGFLEIWGRSMRGATSPAATESFARVQIQLPPNENQTVYYTNYVFSAANGEHLIFLEVVMPAK